MISTIAWRNIWRNKKRSFLVMGAVILGLWSILFATSFSAGMISAMIEKGIRHQHSHLQIHHNNYQKNKEAKHFIEDAESILQKSASDENIQASAARVTTQAMMNTTKGVRGIQVIGVQAEREAQLTDIDQFIITGKYFDGKQRKPILVSKGIAEKMKLKESTKLVLTFQNTLGDISTLSFRVAGIFDTGNAMLDDTRVYVPFKSLQTALGLAEGQAHELAFFLKDASELERSQAALAAIAPRLHVQSWEDLAPEFRVFEEQFRISIYVILFIIMLALIFGIINTMLMAVLERIRELGMLMAVGMNKRKVFNMILTETVLLTLIGAPIGILLAWISITFFSENGINLGAYAEGLSSMGVGHIIRPVFEPEVFFITSIMIIITAILAAVYPAYKAVKLKPVEALRRA